MRSCVFFLSLLLEPPPTMFLFAISPGIVSYGLLSFFVNIIRKQAALAICHYCVSLLSAIHNVSFFLSPFVVIISITVVITYYYYNIN